MGWLVGTLGAKRVIEVRPWRACTAGLGWPKPWAGWEPLGTRPHGGMQGVQRMPGPASRGTAALPARRQVRLPAPTARRPTTLPPCRSARSPATAASPWRWRCPRGPPCWPATGTLRPWPWLGSTGARQGWRKRCEGVAPLWEGYRGVTCEMGGRDLQEAEGRQLAGGGSGSQGESATWGG